LNCVSCQRLKDIIEFLIHHPIRPGEARALQVEDVLLKERHIWIRKTFSMKTLKNRKNRLEYILPLSPYFLSMMERLCKNKLPKAFVFTNEFGKPFSNESLEGAWNNGKKKAELGHLKTPLYQGTKHSWGTQAVNDGIDLNLIQGAMGHSTPEVTKRYARLKAEGLRAVIEKMEGSNVDGSQVVQK
jgi:integrase